MNLAREAAEVHAIARIGAVLPSEPGADVKQEKSDRFANVPLGQRFAAEVLSQFKGDKYLVDVAGNRVWMSLPGSLRPGDQLQISLLAKTPRLTFMLQSAQPPDTASLSPAGRLLGEDPPCG